MSTRLKKAPPKRAAGKTNKCPWCASRSYTRTHKQNILDRIRFIGCEVWLCQRCGKRWGN